MFRVRDRFSQNYKMRTWSGFRMTRHKYIYGIVHGRHQSTDSSKNSITSTMENIALATRTIGGDSSLLFLCKHAFAQPTCIIGRRSKQTKLHLE